MTKLMLWIKPKYKQNTFISYDDHIDCLISNKVEEHQHRYRMVFVLITCVLDVLVLPWVDYTYRWGLPLL